MKVLEPLIYELSAPGRCGVNLPDCDVPESDLPQELLRGELRLPEVSEMQVIRHFVKLSRFNHGVDVGFYPLGSCTMKYNPKINEDMARLPGFAHLHPLTDEDGAQGALALMYTLQTWLAEISGFPGVSLTPSAGAHGEFAGILMVRKYHLDRGQPERNVILVPNSSHGTNPATVAMTGMKVIELPSNQDGNVDLNALREACSGDKAKTIAGMMITAPSTLGLFERHILDVIKTVHAAGGLMYMDGANMNSVLGMAKPAELGFDVMHYNLHKTFGTPHGGGGPGSGPVAAAKHLVDFLPGPIVQIVEEADGDEDAPLYGLVMPSKSIGRMKAFWGNFGIIVRAYTYIAMHGGEGLRDVSRYAVLNANYIRVKLADTYKIPYPRICGHEFVMEGHFTDSDVHALDISKRLIDYGIHPPTNYFPLIVPEALLIEPTETETKADCDYFIETMKTIAQEAREHPELLHDAPHISPVRRVDEVKAVKQLILCCAAAKE